MRDQYSVILNDDGRGEAADLVGLGEDSDGSIKLALVHCKYASQQTPRARVDDLA